jgi:hypothetical protein
LTKRGPAVRDYVAMKPLFIKIWVDDRGGTKKTLTPPLYRAVVDEAHTRTTCPLASTTSRWRMRRS